VTLLAPFYEQAPELAPPAADLEERLRQELPRPLSERLELALFHGWGELLKTDLWGELKLLAVSGRGLSRHGNPAWNALEATLWLTCEGTGWAYFRECLPHPFWNRLPRIAQIGAKIQPLIDLFLAGNFPVGRLEA